MSYELEQPVLKPQIQEFVENAEPEAWRKINADQRYQILHALQRFGVLSDTGFISLNWLLEAKALDIASEKYLKEKIDGIRRAVKEKTAKNLPVIPDLVIKRSAPKPTLATISEKMVSPKEMDERFKKLGINLEAKRLDWGRFYMRSKYWQSGESRALHITSISEASMQQFEDALRNRLIDTVAFDDQRLGDGEAVHRLTGLENHYLIDELNQSSNADAAKLRQLVLINEPLPIGIKTTRRDRKFLHKSKKDTEQFVIGQVNKEKRPHNPKAVRLIGFSVGGGEHHTIQNMAQKLTQPGWNGMSIGTINRILAFLSEKDPDAVRGFTSMNHDAHFANNFTKEGKPIGFQICPVDEDLIATPKTYRSIFTTKHHSPYIPMLVGSPGRI